MLLSPSQSCLASRVYGTLGAAFENEGSVVDSESKKSVETENAESPAKTEGDDSTSLDASSAASSVQTDESTDADEITRRKAQAAAPPGVQVESPKAGQSATESGTVAQHHTYRMLDSILEQPPPKRRFKQPMLFDLLLAAGLLVAVGGFTTGLMKIYITHMAKQSINSHNYKAAITILKRNPVPEFFSGFGSDPNELLNQALYLDAMDKLEANPDDPAALSALEKITADSRFFHLAQEILKEKAQPSQLQLEGEASHQAKPEEITQPTKRPLFEDEDNK